MVELLRPLRLQPIDNRGPGDDRTYSGLGAIVITIIEPLVTEPIVANLSPCLFRGQLQLTFSSLPPS